HAEITPSTPANMNSASLLPGMTKSVVGLYTIPLGAPPVALPPEGTATTSARFAPVVSYRVDAPEWLSLTQSTPVGPNAMPHGFLRLLSTLAAPSPAVSATSRVSRYSRAATFVVVVLEHAASIDVSPATAIAEPRSDDT